MNTLDDILAHRLLAGLDVLGAVPPNRQNTAPNSADADALPGRPLRSMLDELAAAQPDREPWPDDWFEYTDSGQIEACRKLWCQVLLSCVRAALNVDGSNDRQNSRPVPFDWIGSRDFHMICALAGFDGVAVAERLQSEDLIADIRTRFLRQRSSPKPTQEGSGR